MFPYTSPVTQFHTLLECRLEASGVETPRHHVLAGVVINTMAHLVTKGAQARLAHGLVQHILVVSEEITTLCFLSDIDVQFRFDTILEIPLNVLVDGNIIGLDFPALYFKRKPVAADQLHEAQVLFNFLSLVRLFIIQLGDERVFEIVQDFNNARRADVLPNRGGHGLDACTIRQPGTGARKLGPLGTQDPNVRSRKKDPSKRRGRVPRRGAENVQDGLEPVMV